MRIAKKNQNEMKSKMSVCCLCFFIAFVSIFISFSNFIYLFSISCNRSIISFSSFNYFTPNSTPYAFKNTIKNVEEQEEPSYLLNIGSFNIYYYFFFLFLLLLQIYIFIDPKINRNLEKQKKKI